MWRRLPGTGSLTSAGRTGGGGSSNSSSGNRSERLCPAGRDRRKAEPGVQGSPRRQRGFLGDASGTHGSWCDPAADRCATRTARILPRSWPACLAQPLPTHALAPPLQPAVTSATAHLLPPLPSQPMRFINYSMIATEVVFSPEVLQALELLKPSGARIVSIS